MKIKEEEFVKKILNKPVKKGVPTIDTFFEALKAS